MERGKYCAQILYTELLCTFFNAVSFFNNVENALYCMLIVRGVSSVVRRCVHRHTGQELAVKIIEITAEKMTIQQLEEVKISTLKEIQVLNMVKGHPSISTLLFSLLLLRNHKISFHKVW